MRRILIAAAGATIVLGPVFGAGAALADHPLPACGAYDTPPNAPCQAEQGTQDLHGTNHNAPRQSTTDSVSTPGAA